MSRLFIFLNILFVFIATTTSSAEHNPKSKPSANLQPHSFSLPVLRETKSGLYYTEVPIGEPPLKANLAVDFRSPALWFSCETSGYNSTTYMPVLCASPRCKEIVGRCLTCMGGAFGPACRNDICYTDFFYSMLGSQIEDNVTLSYTSPSAYVTSKPLAVRLPIACVHNFPFTVTGHPIIAQGVLGLGNSSTSFVSHLVSSYNVPYKVALCLPSKPGKKASGLAYIGGGPYVQPSNSKDVSGLLVSTPFVRINKQNVQEPEDYFIDVKSIQVNGETLSINQNLLTFNKTRKMGGTTINTLIPYTYLNSSIYKTILEAFAKNAKKLKAVAPFTDCFSSKSFGGKKTPVITIVFGGGVKWNIYEPNLLVKVSKSVVCLGFLDVGSSSKFPVEIGGYQIQDHLVEFDLEASKFSFTPSLLLHNTSCSRM